MPTVKTWMKIQRLYFFFQCELGAVLDFQG